MIGFVEAVSKSEVASFSKENCDAIKIVRGKGVKGDIQSLRTHRELSGQFVDALSLHAVQVIAAESIECLNRDGYRISPGTLGEHITTRGIAIDSLPERTRLSFGRGVVLEIVGRPAVSHYPGINDAAINAVSGPLISGLGVWCHVTKGGKVRARDNVKVEVPSVARTANGIVAPALYADPRRGVQGCPSFN